MENIILIESATNLCSTALIQNGVITAKRLSEGVRSHAALCAPFIDEMLKEAGLCVDDCDAVCVSMGPGSYTGLRVGVSTAKGLCFGADLPLIAVSTLDILAAQAIADGLVRESFKYIVPMIDARRMEVYSAIYSPDGRRLTEIQPVIVDADTFRTQLEEGEVLFIGDGAEKCRAVINDETAHFHQCCPRADAMLTLALNEFRQKNFRDLAYFEPFYLKQFVATVSSKKLF